MDIISVDAAPLDAPAALVVAVAVALVALAVTVAVAVAVTVAVAVAVAAAAAAAVATTPAAKIDALVATLSSTSDEIVFVVFAHVAFDEHSIVAQSAFDVHSFPDSHGGQIIPPQSTSVSSHLCLYCCTCCARERQAARSFHAAWRE